MKFGVGQPVRRLEDPRLLTGRGRYVDDIALPGTLIGHVLRSPVAHGRIVALDVEAARAAPGVHLVLTADDLGDMPPISSRFPITGRDGQPVDPPTLPRLATDRVRFVGQPVAWIVAESRNAALDAAELVELEIEDLPVVTGTADALAGGAPQLYDNLPGNVVYDWEIGDAGPVEAAFARAAHVARCRVVNQRVVVNSLEPRAFLVRYLSDTGRWEFWMSNQGAHSARDALARALNVEPARIRAHTPDVGGGFGMKLMEYSEYALAAVSAQRLGRPVKWVGERSESFVSDTQGRDLDTDVEAAFDASGRVLAMRADSRSNLGAYASSAGMAVHTLFSAGLLGGMYDVPAMYHRVRGVVSNTPPADAYRGAGRPEAIHVTEQVMARAAADMSIDPAELRRRNLLRPDQVPYRTVGGLTFDSLDPETNLDATLQRIDYTGFPARRAEAEASGMLRGIGIAYYFERTGGGPFENARLTLGADGRLTIAIGTQSNGQGHATAWAQIVHEKLGLPIGDIELLEGDSDALPGGGGTGGSRSLVMAHRVLIKAAEEVIEKGLARAAEHLEVAARDVEFLPGEGGVFRIRGTDLQVGLAELAAEAPIEGMGEVNDTHPTFPNGAHAAEVEIDPETGALSLLRYVFTDDFGTVINPLLVEGQIHGGVAQGAGQVICEQAVFDPQTGQPLTGSFMDYAMPRADQLPFLESAFNPVPSPSNPLGVKGCGEAGSVAAIPTISLAIQNALEHTGVTQLTPPFTPLRLWQALADYRNQRHTAR